MNHIDTDHIFSDDHTSSIDIESHANFPPFESTISNKRESKALYEECKRKMHNPPIANSHIHSCRRAGKTSFIHYHVRNRWKKLASSHSSAARLQNVRCSREELMNFWMDLSLIARRPLLRFRRDVFLKILDQFLIRQNLCFECHENVIAEWEDHERKRTRKRSLLDVFSVYPPFLDSDEEDEIDEEEEEYEDVMEIEPDLNGHGIRPAEKHFAPCNCSHYESKRSVSLHEPEIKGFRDDASENLYRIVQNEQRFVLITDDHDEFIEDLIRCGEQFDYLMPLLQDNEIPIGMPSRLYDDDYYYDGGDSIECPGASTPRSAQEYLLDVLTIQFRDELSKAYQDAIQQSLAAQAELLKDESIVQSSSKSNKKKKKRRRRKELSHVLQESLLFESSQDPMFPCATPDGNAKELDQEVEEFRLLLERINAESSHRARRKLVLPPGAFNSCFSEQPARQNPMTRLDAHSM